MMMQRVSCEAGVVPACRQARTGKKTKKVKNEK
jgi:hypothetical protein